ncbi:MULTISPECIES: tetratricopeptide repeat protein [Tsukamurella]|uniref:tetratricopeptide repeat protein n=1 Tax=Tsukamurella TaxID=2060 RepID=UPI00223BB30F|nr:MULTISPECIES: tetratricopeptide repeat protein [Tsukamurella]
MSDLIRNYGGRERRNDGLERRHRRGLGAPGHRRPGCLPRPDGTRRRGPRVPDGVRRFETAGAHDALDRPDLAVPGYRAALDAGLDDHRARRATIQLASSLRNLGAPDEGLRLLAALDTDCEDGYDDAVVVFRALMLADMGREREALAATLHALANHLPRYRISAHHYPDALIEG